MIVEAAILLKTMALIATLILVIVGVAFGQLRIGKAALIAHDMQPQAQSAIARTTIISMGISETACILALTGIIMVLFKQPVVGVQEVFANIAYSSIVFALGISGLCVGFCSCLPAQTALYSVARQPFFANKIINVMLITMSIIQTPVIFGFVITLLISLQASTLASVNEAYKLCAAAWCVGIGSIGPLVGQGLFAQSACFVVGLNRKNYTQILTFALLSQTLIETPIIIALLVSILVFSAPAVTTAKLIALIAAAVCQSICNFMPGIASGRTSATACRQLGGANNTASVTGVSLLAQGLLDTFAIYGLLVSILLIYGS